MLTEKFTASNVGGKRLHRLMPAYLLHFEDARAGRFRFGQEAGAETVACVMRGVISGRSRVLLHQPGNSAIGPWD